MLILLQKDKLENIMEEKKYQKFTASDKVNSQIIGEIARVKALTKTKDVQLAKSLGKTKQNYSRMIINGLQQIGNIEAIANAMGFDLEIKFVERKGE